MERLIKIAADLLDFCEARSWRADRPRDWVDIEGVLVRQGSALDLKRIEIELRPLVAAKEAPGILTRLKQMLHSL